MRDLPPSLGAFLPLATRPRSNVARPPECQLTCRRGVEGGGAGRGGAGSGGADGGCQSERVIQVFSSAVSIFGGGEGRPPSCASTPTSPPPSSPSSPPRSSLHQLSLKSYKKIAPLLTSPALAGRKDATTVFAAHVSRSHNPPVPCNTRLKGRMSTPPVEPIAAPPTHRPATLVSRGRRPEPLPSSAGAPRDGWIVRCRRRPGH
ncbi:hypothetical protein E2C01_065614 [Portunus trituberculatus]|uniref:Uncharacterized protein n=1 Tax=Portunus trituberculatus TaxID=210409 RepID=A0A5B7HQ26_PORTR|nr:hypothetical protein [Portunus trituberculatus]